LSAACDCVEHHFMGMLAIQRVVGGRVVPPAWAPRTHAELAAIRQEAGLRILDTIGGFDDDRLTSGLLGVVEHLQTFTGLGLLDRLRALLQRVNLREPIRRLLGGTFDPATSILRQRSREQAAASTALVFEEWRAELSPKDLGTQVRDLTAQQYWTVGDQEA